jgi:Fe-S oxidoreductase/nitrate reductase gamma subunit
MAAVAMAIFAYGVWQRVLLWRQGKPESGRLDRPKERALALLRYGFVQVKILKETYPGAFHALLFWGFAVLFVGTTTTVLDEDFYRLITGDKFIQGNFYVGFSFVLDIVGALAILGLLMALYRRYVTKPARLDNQKEDSVLLLLILAILATGFLSEAGRIAHEMPAFETYSSPVGYALAALLAGLPESARSGFHVLMWFTHMFLSLGFIAYLPYSKGLHILTGWANVYTSNLGPKGTLRPIPDMMARMEAGEDTEMGYKALADLTWKDRLMVDACTRCGRCQDACPAKATNKHLNPKEVIQALRTLMLEKTNGAGPRPLLKAEDEEKGALSTEVLWQCTNCMACMNACPVMIEHIPLIVQMRRELAMEFDAMEPACRKFFKNMDVNANPWGMNPAERVNWTAGLDVPTVFDKPDFEYLLWVGCLGAFDQRSQKISQAVVKVLTAAGVNFAILGELEICCGDPVRRLGNEASFQAMVKMTTDNLKEAEVHVKKVITTCPHCFNTLAHDYKDFGVSWEVVHHTVFLADLVRQGRITLTPGDPVTAALHDSCFLGRYNDVYDAPRQLAEASGARLVEFEKSRDNGFCCGGGGGRTWLEEEVHTVEDKINVTRVTQLGATGAKLILSACPYCMMMFDEGTKLKKVNQGDPLWNIHGVGHTEAARKGETQVDLFDLVQLKDVAELVAERMATPKTA